MRFIVIVKASKESEGGVMPTEQELRDMGNFNDELVNKGVMLAGEGLHPSSKGVRIHYSGSERKVAKGPFPDPEQLVAGYPATPEGQAANFRDVLSIVRGIPGGRGLGAFYWDATWTAVEGNGWDPEDPSSGNAWENQAMFDFDDRALPVMSEFIR